ncbi:MAG: glycosyltransferase family 9 protein [Desulfuromonadaceae bacterium]|nr:glycosyltransferase family 9 protein [Desulfuromonadaceae bacterium]MDD2854298.1 glycosyltransferase family 9 protein [Desulfuromonadaceae bacterium]
MDKKPVNILIIKPGAMGDLLHLTPSIRALKSRFPEARIDTMVGNTPSVDLFRHNPFISDILVYDRFAAHKSLSALFSLWSEISSRSYDLVINFQRSNLKTWFLASAALPCRFLVYHKTRSRQIHAVQDHLKTLAPLGVEEPGDYLDLYLAEEQRYFAAELFKSHGLDERPVIALNPGASHPVNRWSTANFAVLADRLTNELQATVIVIGGSADTPLADEIASQSTAQPLILTGKTSMLQLGAVLEKSAVLISGDTGPMHMATAVGTAVIALFGAADPDRTGPVGSGHRVIMADGLPCVPCRSRKCDNSVYMECMKLIAVDTVFEAVKEVLEQGKPCAS